MQTPTKITAMVIPTTVAFPAKLLVGPSKYHSKYKRKKEHKTIRTSCRKKKQKNCLLLKYYLFRPFLNIILYYIVYTLYGTSAPLGCIMLVCRLSLPDAILPPKTHINTPSELF